MGRHVEALIQDVRFSVRLLLRERAFTATVLVTLALSRGLTSAVFTLVDALLLRPLPVSSPEQLFTIAAPGRNVDLNPSYYSHAFYERLRTSSPQFRNLLASATTVSSAVNLSDGAVPDRVRCELVSGNYFDVLGAGAAAGRVLTSQDDQTPGASPVLVLSYAFWQRHLGTILSVSAMLIAAVGLYGLISFSVAQRTREIGIRIAIGAEPRQIPLMVLGRAYVLVAVGIALGVPITLGSLRAATSVLYGVVPWHLGILAGVLSLVTVVALSAALIPAGRAARTDAWNALRSE